MRRVSLCLACASFGSDEEQGGDDGCPWQSHRGGGVHHKSPPHLLCEQGKERDEGKPEKSQKNDRNLNHIS